MLYSENSHTACPRLKHLVADLGKHPLYCSGVHSKGENCKDV